MNYDHAIWCRCEPCRDEYAERLDLRIWREDRMNEQNGPRHE